MCEVITKIRKGRRRRQKLKGLMRSEHSARDKEGEGEQEEQRNGLKERNVGNHKEKIGERRWIE